MRLINPSAGDGVDQEDFDGSAERKRSRPTSSLDIKVPNGHKQTTPPVRDGRRKPTRPPTQQLQQQQQQRHINPRVTRARGGGGIPPRPFDFLSNSLDGLTDEQLRMALAQDPELAAAAAAAAEAAGGDKTRKRSPYYRSRDGTVNTLNDHPEHLRAMMEEGIPVKQWIILLLLLGAGLYQLRKVLLGPMTEKNGKKTAPPKKSPQKGPRKVGKQQKGKKVSAPAKSETPRSVPTPASEKKPVKQKAKKVGAPVQSEAPGAVPALTTEEKTATAPLEKESVAPDNGKEGAAVGAKKAKPVKKKKKAMKKAEPKKESEKENLTADDAKQRQSPGVASTDGSSAADLVADSEGIRGGEEPAGEGNGWQTVGKGSAADKGQGKNGVKVPDVAHHAENEVPKPAKETSAAESTAAAPKESKKAPLKAATEPASKNNGASNDTTSKKTKMAEATSSAAPAVPEVASMDDDAALALKLQEEEEKLAEAFSSPAGEDSWAEVTPKKSRRRSAEPEADAAPAATTAW